MARAFSGQIRVGLSYREQMTNPGWGDRIEGLAVTDHTLFSNWDKFENYLENQWIIHGRSGDPSDYVGLIDRLQEMYDVYAEVEAVENR